MLEIVVKHGAQFQIPHVETSFYVLEKAGQYSQGYDARMG